MDSKTKDQIKAGPIGDSIVKLLEYCEELELRVHVLENKTRNLPQFQKPIKRVLNPETGGIKHV